VAAESLLERGLSEQRPLCVCNLPGHKDPDRLEQNVVTPCFSRIRTSPGADPSFQDPFDPDIVEENCPMIGAERNGGDDRGYHTAKIPGSISEGPHSESVFLFIKKMLKTNSLSSEKHALPFDDGSREY